MEQVVNQAPVRPGQIWYNHPGIVHSLEGGALVAEVQQNSNTTYSVYDFNRKDDSDNMRDGFIHTVIYNGKGAGCHRLCAPAGR